MITGEWFLDALHERGNHLLVGVPCSTLGSVYAALDTDPRFGYLPAPNEGTAFAVAAGSLLAGEDCAVLAQNSGLGNLINPLTSFAMPYRVPVVTFLTLRGWPEPVPDEPQHDVMGRATTGILDAVGVPWLMMTGDPSELDSLLDRVHEARRDGPAFVLVPPGVFTSATAPVAAAGADVFGRRAALSALLDRFGDALFVTTTGHLSRELFALCDRPENFYLQGAMGHASAVALGVAVAIAREHPRRTVVAVDGDGSALMHLGVMSLSGHVAPPNLVHAVVDNGCYASTGCQVSTSASTRFADVALACGYTVSVTAGSDPELRQVLASLPSGGSVLVHIRISGVDTRPTARASAAISAQEIAARFAKTVQAR